MPEIYDKNPATKSQYDGEAEKKKKYAKLGAKITDNVPHKLFGLKTTDEEYWVCARSSAKTRWTSPCP